MEDINEQLESLSEKCENDDTWNACYDGKVCLRLRSCKVSVTYKRDHSSTTEEPENPTYRERLHYYYREFFKLSEKGKRRIAAYEMRTQRTPYDELIAEMEKFLIERGEPATEARQVAKECYSGRIFPPLVSIPFLHDLKITVNLEDDFDAIKNQLSDFINNELKNIWNIKNELLAGECTDFIRDEIGRKTIRPFATWDRCLEAYRLNHGEGKGLTDIVCQTKRGSKRNSKKAMENGVRDDIKTVIIFIKRAEKGTFPYDENGEFEYRSKFPLIKL